MKRRIFFMLGLLALLGGGCGATDDGLYTGSRPSRYASPPLPFPSMEEPIHPRSMEDASIPQGVMNR